MRTRRDVANALLGVVEKLRSPERKETLERIRDENGNRVGVWSLTANQPPSDRLARLAAFVRDMKCRSCDSGTVSLPGSGYRMRPCTDCNGTGKDLAAEGLLAELGME